MTASCAPLTLLSRAFLPVLKRCADTLSCKTVLDFGPCSLPSVQGLDIIPVQEDHGTPLRHGTTGCPSSVLAVSCFPLSLLTPDQLGAHLSAMHDSALFSIFADFKIAERNIEIPGCLLMGGMRTLGQSAGNAFQTLGGLEGMLYREACRFRVMERHTLMAGSLACILVENIRD